MKKLLLVSLVLVQACGAVSPYAYNRRSVEIDMAREQALLECSHDPACAYPVPYYLK